MSDENETKSDLGNFSVSLAVADLATSRRFYEALGFAAMEPGGEGAGWQGYGESWLILQTTGATIGLFQGMFDQNILTFNPTDVRSVQQRLRAAGVEVQQAADPETTGPAHCMLQDPDGNAILLDQH